MSKPNPSVRKKSSKPVANVVSPESPPVQYVSEVGRLHQLREFYKQAKKENFEQLRIKVENQRCNVQNNVDQLQTLIGLDRQMLSALKQEHESTLDSVKTARDAALKSKMELNDDRFNEEIDSIEMAANTILNKLKIEK